MRLLYSIVISGLLFVISFFLPALLFQEVDPVMGATLLGWGWWGLMLGNPAWCANLLYLSAVVAFLFQKYIFAAIVSGLAFVVGLLSFLATEYYFNEVGGTPIAGLGLAFYIWMLNFGVLVVGSLLLVMSKGE